MSRVHSNRSSTSLTQRNLPTNKLGGKNEWKAIIDHQSDMAQQQLATEKQKKEQRARELSAALTQMNVERSLKKEVQNEKRTQEKKESNDQKAAYEEDLRQNRQQFDKNTKNMRTELLHQRKKSEFELNKQKQAENKMDDDMVKKAKEETVKAQTLSDQKKNNLKTAITENMMVNESRKIMQEQKRKEEKEDFQKKVTQANYNDYLREKNYKDYYNKLSESQQKKVDAHSQQVLARELSREKEVNNFVEKGVKNDQKKRYQQYLNDVQNSEETRKNLKATLRKQMGEVEYSKMCEKQDYPKKVAEGMRQTRDYNLGLAADRQSSLQKQKSYKLMLDQQNFNMDEARRNADKMSSEELKLNSGSIKAYQSGQSNSNVLIPGLISSKKADGQSTPGATARLPVRNLSFSDQASSHLSDRRSSLTVRSHLSDTSSPTHWFGMRKSSQPNFTNNLGAYNPITNPIENYNQNPYFLK